MSIKNIKSIHKIGEKFEVKNPFIKVLCDNHEFEIISIANNIDVKISNIPQPCIPTVFSPYNFRQTIKDKEKKLLSKMLFYIKSAMIQIKQLLISMST